jgi:ABC-type phosphate transport system ATPase subunit
MSQADRVSAYTTFMHLGEIVEMGSTVHVFEIPRNKLTEE